MNRRAGIIGANLLVPAGVLFFGWNAAAAVFLIWLDMLLFSISLAILVFAAIGQKLAAPAGTHKGGWMIGIGIGMLFVAPIFIAPPLVVGAELLAFLFAASAFLMVTELHENWLARLYGRWRAWEEALKARR